MADLLAQQVIEPTQYGPGPTPAAAPLVQGLQAFLAARAGRKADEAEETALETKTRAEREAAQQVAATGSQIAGRLVGGAPVRDIAPPDASGLGEVAIESRYRKDPEGALAIGMTQRGGEAISKAPLLASMLANQMKEPKEPKAPTVAGGMMWSAEQNKFVPIEGYADQQERIARAKRPDVVVTGGGGMGKPPAGYRYTAGGDLEAILGGPADPSRERVMPGSITKNVVEERARGRKFADISSRADKFISAIEGGQLPLSPVSSAKYQAQRLFDSNRGVQPSEKEPYVRFFDLQRFVNEQVNVILNLAKGPQTEGDALRARQQILDNPNNEKVVVSALKNLQRIYNKEAELSEQTAADYETQYGRGVTPTAPSRSKW
jgi:hypothetical protein